jgi:hypothetical protein
MRGRAAQVEPEASDFDLFCHQRQKVLSIDILKSFFQLIA